MNILLEGIGSRNTERDAAQIAWYINYKSKEQPKNMLANYWFWQRKRFEPLLITDPANPICKLIDSKITNTQYLLMTTKKQEAANRLAQQRLLSLKALPFLQVNKVVVFESAIGPEVCDN